MPCPISIQLYTLREAASSDLPGVIERLGRIGFAGVEVASLHDLPAVEFRKRVEDAGMKITAAHVTPPVGDAARAILDEQETLGVRDLVVAFQPPDRFQDEAGIQGVADLLNEANANARERGMRIGYHNHFWELERRLGDVSALTALFDRVDETVFAEIDTYWARVGGEDPSALVRSLGTRARLLHVKDGPADAPRSPMTAVGSGVLDFPRILASNDAIEWHIVELDACATDMFEAVEQSYRYLTEAGLSTGRV